MIKIQFQIIILNILFLIYMYISNAQLSAVINTDKLAITSDDIIEKEFPVVVRPGFILIKDTYYEWEVNHWGEGHSKLWSYENNKLKQIFNIISPYKINFFYDENDYLISKLRVDEKFKNDFDTTKIDSFLYDSSGKLIDEFDFLLESDYLHKSQRRQFFYDSLNRLIEEKSFLGYYEDIFDSNGQWVFDNSRYYVYDVNSNLITITPSNHHPSYIKIEFLYNNENLKTNELGYQWYNDNWNKVYQITWNYNDKNALIESLHEWQEEQIYHFLYEYDNNGTKRRRTYEKFVNNEWDTTYKSFIDYSYDADFNLTKELKTIYENGNIRNTYFIEYDYDKILNIDDYSSFNEFYNKKLEISPNPASEYIEINLGTNSRQQTYFDGLSMTDGRQEWNIQIYNVYGECVLSVGVNGRSPVLRIDVSGFPDGMYFVRVGNFVKSFVKM